MKVIIEDDEGRRTVIPIVRDELLIGRSDTNTIRLTEKNVSRKHARLLREEGRFFIEDLQSFTGIKVNGERVLGKRTVSEGDLIQISEYDLVLQAAPGEKVPPPLDGAEIVDEDVIVTGPIPPAAGATSAEAEAEREKDTSVIRMADVSGAAQTPSRDLLPAEQPRLTVEDGALAGTAYVLVRSPAAIGRTSENDVVLEDPSVSRYHCKLFLDGDTWKLLDNRSAHGVKVNGEPYATCRVTSGDVIEIGRVKLRFQGASAAPQLPPLDEAAPVTPTEVSKVSATPPRSSSGKLLALGVVAVCAIALAVVMVQRSRKVAVARSSAPVEDDGIAVVTIEQDNIQAALANANTALREHRYSDALTQFAAAQKAGASAEAVKPSRIAVKELADQATLAQLDGYLAVKKFDEARALLDAQPAQQGFYADQIRERGPAVQKGYADDHAARAEAIRAESPETCAAEAQLALGADPTNVKAQQVLATCGKPKAEPAVQKAPATPVPQKPLVARTVVADDSPTPNDAADPDSQSKKLVAEGNQKLLAEDFESALALFEQALALKPSQPILATLYRSMGITLTRQGKLEEGAQYYRLYLPLCTNAKEKEYLTRTLEEYEARRR